MNCAEMGKQTRKRILDAINSYIDLHQYPPTTKEICDMVGLKSTSSVNHHVNMMLISGELETDHGFGASRALRVPNRAAQFDALYLAKCQEVNELRARIENMADQREADCCVWKYDDEEDYYETSCGHLQVIMGGTPTENGYKFCPYCGRKIVEVE